MTRARSGAGTNVGRSIWWQHRTKHPSVNPAGRSKVTAVTLRVEIPEKGTKTGGYKNCKSPYNYQALVTADSAASRLGRHQCVSETPTRGECRIVHEPAADGHPVAGDGGACRLRAQDVDADAAEHGAHLALGEEPRLVPVDMGDDGLSEVVAIGPGYIVGFHAKDPCRVCSGGQSVSRTSRRHRRTNSGARRCLVTTAQ